MNSSTTKAAAALAACSTGLFLALVATAAPAVADPVSPAVADPAPPVVPPGPVAVVPPAPSAATVQSADTDAAPVTPVAAGVVTPPPNGVPHLASPDALPPGSTMDPQDQDSPNVSYLKDLWQAVQNHEISGKEALVMGLAQRGMNTPYPNQAPGPNVPISPGDPAPVGPPPPALPAPAPAPTP